MKIFKDVVFKFYMTTKTQIRQPIVTVAGHVDHGKTSILDMIRGSCVAQGEAGGITQKISFTLFPREDILERCPIIKQKKLNLEIPGFLFIDTPGHAAFSNLRKRGGSLADLAILVIDINEGIKPQTAEVIQILKINKTPFIIALNKIDHISGWRKQDESLIKSIGMQAINVKQQFDEKLMTLMGSLHSHGFETSPFYEIDDFTKKVALVPCSARTGEGIPELVMTLCGLSQKFLRGKLELKEEAKGVILEVKKEKTVNYLEAILYDGKLTNKDEIAVGSFGEPIIGKIRFLEEIQPLSNKFKAVDEVSAATGIKIQLSESIDILPGMPFQVFKNNKDEIIKEFKKQIRDNIQTDDEGIIAKADSLGSLEALLVLLKQENISVCRAGIGRIDKKDVICAKTNLEKDATKAVVIGFNVTHDDEIKEMGIENIKIIEEEVVYKLIEKLKEYIENKRKEVEKEKLMKLATICKLKILGEHVFHNSNPAIFGVRVEAGKLRERCTLINENGEEVSDVKRMQSDKKGIDEATAGMEIAISLPGTNFERQLTGKDFLYSDISPAQFREFKKNKELLSREEIEVLQKISQIKRAKEPTWGV